MVSRNAKEFKTYKTKNAIKKIRGSLSKNKILIMRRSLHVA